MRALRHSLKIIANPLLTLHFKFDHVIHTMTIIHYVSLKIPGGAPASGAPLVPTPMYAVGHGYNTYIDCSITGINYCPGNY